MKYKAFCTIFLLLTLVPFNDARAQVELKIGIVFSPVAALTIFDAANQFVNVADETENAFSGSGMFPPTMALYPTLKGVGQGFGADIIEQGTSYSSYRLFAALDPEIRAWRDAENIDLIVLVVGYFRYDENQLACGLADGKISHANSLPGAAAWLANITTPLAYADHHIAIVSTKRILCGTQVGARSIVAHEIGHLMGADHETSDDGNNDIDKPVSYNHGAVITDGQSTWTTIMAFGGEATNWFSGEGSFVGPGFSTVGPETNNRKLLIEDFMRDFVALYRPRNSSSSSPGGCSIGFSVIACNPNGPVIQTSASLSGFTVDHAVYDLETGPGIFDEIFSGILTCPAFGGWGGQIARALLDTEYGASQCEVYITGQGQSCNNNNNPPF